MKCLFSIHSLRNPIVLQVRLSWIVLSCLIVVNLRIGRTGILILNVLQIWKILNILHINLLVVFLKIASIFILNHILSLDDILVVYIFIIHLCVVSMITSDWTSLMIDLILGLCISGIFDGIAWWWNAILSTWAIAMS